jgi:high-affinity iron transporter
MANAIFIVWRESVEAILVISILYAWIRERGGGRVRLAHLWAGVAGGVGVALLLAVAMLSVQTRLAGSALDAFQVAIVFAAAALITQMVLWMRRHGRRMKSELETGLERAATGAGGLAAAGLAAIAVAREGAETVLFVYGLALERHGAELASLFLGVAVGLLLALATAWLIAKGRQVVSWRTFFRVTEVLLLLLAASLIVSGTEKLIDLEWLPPLVEPLWDTSALLDDAGGLGGIVAAFTGYRAQPSLTIVLVYFAYWAVVWLLMARSNRAQPGRPAPGPGARPSERIT